MMSSCETVAERTALGEPLGELADHATTCATCQRTLATAGQLGVVHAAVDPGLGFSSRMTVGAQHRIAVRKRRRIAVGLAATVAAGAVGVFLFTRTPAPASAPALPATATQTQPSPEPAPDVAADADLKALVNLADVDRSSRLSARWGHINKPLRPYRKLLEGLTP